MLIMAVNNRMLEEVMTRSKVLFNFYYINALIVLIYRVADAKQQQ